MIAGTAKGRRLTVPKGRVVRPTSDYLREAFFNILGGKTEGAAFLDLFAGSGAVGIEALSRGAASATFVEKDPQSLKALRENLTRTSFEGRAEVVQADVLRLLKDPNFRRSYDLIFLDPPYRGLLAYETLQLLGRGRFLNPKGLVIVECFHKWPLPSQVGILRLTREVRHGETKLAFYEADVGC